MFISKLAHIIHADTEVNFKTKKEDDETVIDALISGKKVGEVIFKEEYVDDDYPFGTYKDDISEKLYEKITSHQVVINIQHLEVDSNLRNQGIASKLMEKAMKVIQKQYPGDPVYINASPLNMSLPLDTLIAFYKKFGFKVLKKYPKFRNAFLWKD